MLPRGRCLLTFRSEAQARSAFPLWGCTSQEWKRARLRREGRDEEPARGCGCCRAWIERYLALPGDRRERENRRGGFFPFRGLKDPPRGGPRPNLRGGLRGEGGGGVSVWGINFLRGGAACG